MILGVNFSFIFSKKFIVYLLLICFCSCNTFIKEEINGSVYGTTYKIQYYAESHEDFNFSKQIDSIFDDIDFSMSTYKSNSIISRINKNEVLEIDNHFLNVFKTSKEIYKITNGRFDPSIGILVNYWGFGADKPDREKSLNEVKAKVGLSKFDLSENLLQRPQDSYIDFNAIAKGYAVDQIAEFLENNDIDNFLIEVGGEIRASGKNLALYNPWNIGIDMPRFDGGRSIYSTVLMSDVSLASSGTYRKYKIDSLGNKYAHIIDPRTGKPIKTNILSVNIKTNKCINADAYATALHVMNLNEIEIFLNDKENISALVIYENEDNELDFIDFNDFYN
jgi:thiamine biosynthesis lipoprotein